VVVVTAAADVLLVNGYEVLVVELTLAGQFVTVGLHWVMVMVLVRVCVLVVVSATTSDRQMASAAERLMICILADVVC